MDAAQIKAFQVKVKSLGRTLKEYKAYSAEVQAYDLNVVSQDKKKQEFYLQSKSAMEQVQKQLLKYYQGLNGYIQQNQTAIQAEQAVQDEYNTAKSQMSQIQALLPAAC